MPIINIFKQIFPKCEKNILEYRAIFLYNNIGLIFFYQRIIKEANKVLNSSNSVVLTEKCGFFDIDCNDGFKILKSDSTLKDIVGFDAEGSCYINLVCPEDRENVTQKLTDLYNAGVNGNDTDSGACIRHRIIMDDKSVHTVLVTVRYSNNMLCCAIIRTFDAITGDAAKYKSNNAIESVAISSAAIFITDGGHIIVKYANDEFYNMIGWNRLEFKEFFNECLNDIIYQSDFEYFFNNLTVLSAQNSDVVFETRTVASDGSIRWNEIRAKYLSSESNRPVISLVFGDVTRCKNSQRTLSVQNERFNIVQKNAENIIFDYYTETDKAIFTGNVSGMSKYLRLYDVSMVNSELIINDFFCSNCARSFLNSEDYEKLSNNFANVIITGKGGSFDFIMTTIDNSPGQWFLCTYSAVCDEFGNVVRIVGSFKNIDKRKRNELVMENRMQCDSLTGLLNKETACKNIEDFLENTENNSSGVEKLHALMIIDIDNFRVINNTFGHTFGDSVIQEFASDIKSSFRDTDIVGRLGGDEFIILMKNVTVKSASKKAGRLCRSLVKKYSVHKHNICLSCSIGMAFYGKDALSFDDLYQYADIAMYGAKVNGRCAYELYDSESADTYASFSEMHGRTQMDPPANTTEAGDLDTNLIDIAFSLIAASDDILGTVDILLRTVGRKYNLSAISVLVKDYNRNKMCVISQWLSSRYSYRAEISDMEYDIDDRFDNVFNGSNLKCISDISLSNLLPVVKNNMKNATISACVLGKLEGRAGTNYGYIIFSQLERKRKWSRKEANTFKYIAKILSIALVDRHIGIETMVSCNESQQEQTEE